MGISGSRRPSQSTQWYEISVLAIRWEGNDLWLEIARGRLHEQLRSCFPLFHTWVTNKPSLDSCVDALKELFVYASLEGHGIAEMKTFAPSQRSGAIVSMPDYWSSRKASWSVGAPKRGTERGGWQKCPVCGKDSETEIVRTSRRIFHKCCECGVLIETAERGIFL